MTIRTKAATQEYRDNWDRVFRKGKAERRTGPRWCGPLNQGGGVDEAMEDSMRPCACERCTCGKDLNAGPP